MWRTERGSITPLIIGFAVVLAMLVAVVVDASAAFLRRQELESIADAAALAATDGIEGDAVYTHGLGRRGRIDSSAARVHVAEYFRTSGADLRFPGLSYDVTTSTNTVVIRVSATMDLPLHQPGLGEDTVVRGTAASVVEVSGAP